MIGLPKVVKEIEKEIQVSHLSTDEDIRSRLAFLFNANDIALSSELENLQKIGFIVRIAMWCGLGLLVLGVLLAIFQFVELGIISGACGIFFSFYQSHLISRLGEARREIKKSLPSYRSLYALLLLLEEGDQNTKERTIGTVRVANKDQLKS